MGWKDMAGGRTQNGPLSHMLPHDTPATRPDCETTSDFSPAGCALREEQVGVVRAKYKPFAVD